MNLKLLEYLVAIGETHRFGEAARRCGVTQPTLSAQIARLEADLDVQLVERGRHGARLTPIGQRVVEQATVLLDASARLRRLCRDQGEPLAGPLHLGIIPTAGPYLMPRLIPVFKKHYPSTRPVIDEQMTDRLLHGLRRGELDAAILALPVDGPTLVHEPLLDEPFLAALPPGHRLARLKRLSREHLADQPLLLLREGHCLREQTASFCRMNPDAAEIQGASLEGLKQMVAMGLGCTVLPELAITGPFARTAQIELRPFKTPAPSRRLALVWRRSHPYYGALRGLAAAFRNGLRRLQKRSGASASVCD